VIYTTLDFLTHNAGLIGLAIFVTLFVVMVGWALRPNSKDLMEKHGRIPFKESEKNE
tara:strand:+ start:1242 stop:1412 length:171 start_codon:yes stop_codon:yes gene_type:complete